MVDILRDQEEGDQARRNSPWLQRAKTDAYCLTDGVHLTFPFNEWP